jgi:hypothetical protein
MKNELKKIAEPESVDSIAHQLRSHATAFHSTVRSGSIKLKEFQKFCELCDAEIIVRKADGKEIKF